MAYIHRNDTLVSHLCFADDMIIFANGQKQSVQRLFHCLEHYERVSGQLVNRDKSGFMVPKRSPPSRIQILEHITGFKRQHQPFTYLGIPLFKGARKTFVYDDLLQKIKSRISGWAFRLLSSGGRITLLRCVLSSLPLYLLQIMQPPKTSAEEEIRGRGLGFLFEALVVIQITAVASGLSFYWASIAGATIPFWPPYHILLPQFGGG
ncbi:RNase H domain-containing protein [Abeliophyllum distichum]|uniref:RNase H domain-containing protein n=1 Tax=Abeliophyllum distichum TaxID=126358 RepID=A0ABD1TII1_9LAMI